MKKHAHNDQNTQTSIRNSTHWMSIQAKGKGFGGAAIEYVLVSTFAVCLTVAGLAYVAKVLQDKLQKVSEKTGVDAPDLENLFGRDQ